MRMTCALIVLLSTTSLSLALPPSKDLTLSAAVELKKARKRPPRQGGPLDKVELKMWIPGDIAQIKGAVVNPFYIKAVGQKHWQAAARSWGFGVVGANYFGVKNTEFADTLKQALVDFAKQCGRKEIADIPLCFVGMSAGGGMSVRFADQLPKRTIAAAPVCLEVGPRSPASRAIPIVTIFGERDGRQMEKLATRLPEERKLGALWATAVQWRRRHEFARANNLIFPFFDQVIRMRSVKGKSISLNNGWLAYPSTWATPFPKISKSGSEVKPHEACWLPNRYTAFAWRSFVAKDSPIKITAPPGQGDGKTFRTYSSKDRITVSVAVKGKEMAREISLYDGDKLVGKSASAPYRFELEFEPGIHALNAIAQIEGSQQAVSQLVTIVVTK